MIAGVDATGQLAAVDTAALGMQIRRPRQDTSSTSSEAGMRTKLIDIEWYHRGAIIGKKGQTVQHIKHQSGLQDIAVKNGIGGQQKVLLRGTVEAITAAENMVENVCSASTPCRYFSTKKGCKNGSSCSYSHMSKVPSKRYHII
mmetsp:Transcript_135023/g.269466  ORF Transcript_135023/g.269466 Transcript_135023/m.269466 type:complete len:144 (-) Transcript_135023:39-470(-)